jgi:hypothetical protein
MLHIYKQQWICGGSLLVDKKKTNGSAARRCPSWIEAFVDSTASLEAPAIFRRWAAISTIAACLEQKVYVMSGGSRLFPNIYCALIAHPGVGKTRCIHAAKDYYLEIPEPHPAPTSMSASSMIDAVSKGKRSIMRLPEGMVEYNTLYITADELSAFMHKYDEEAIGTMSAFYDPRPYGQTRRGNDINIKIKSPQLNLIVGTTPSNLMKYMPETAWEQGFTSRIVMLFSDERTIGDDFAEHEKNLNPDLIHDLVSISGLVGEFKVTPEYRSAVNAWRNLGEPPVPNHPKLIHYATRRRIHLYKLSMVSAIDRSDVLLLTKDDFNRAMGWMLEAEMTMPDIFKAGAGNADAKAMDEIYHFVLTTGHTNPVPERKIINYAKELIPIHSIERAVKIMEQSGMIVATHIDKRTGQRLFKAVTPELNTQSDVI